MTDNDIMKALGICSSEHLGCEDGCPYVEVPCLGGDALFKDALTLVKTKDTEIDILIRKNETLKDENFELKAEVERLQTFCDIYSTEGERAVKQFVALFKKRAMATCKDNDGNCRYEVDDKFIDKLLKEVVGESDV